MVELPWHGRSTDAVHKLLGAELIKKLWKVALDMWRHRISTLHKTEAGKVLIAESNINETVIQVHLAGSQHMLQEDLPIIRILLKHLIASTLAYKQQWLESMITAHTRLRKKQEQGQRE